MSTFLVDPPPPPPAASLPPLSSPPQAATNTPRATQYDQQGPPARAGGLRRLPHVTPPLYCSSERSSNTRTSHDSRSRLSPGPRSVPDSRSRAATGNGTPTRCHDQFDTNRSRSPSRLRARVTVTLGGRSVQGSGSSPQPAAERHRELPVGQRADVGHAPAAVRVGCDGGPAAEVRMLVAHKTLGTVPHERVGPAGRGRALAERRDRRRAPERQRAPSGSCTRRSSRRRRPGAGRA